MGVSLVVLKVLRLGKGRVIIVFRVSSIEVVVSVKYCWVEVEFMGWVSGKWGVGGGFRSIFCRNVNIKEIVKIGGSRR